MSSGRGGSEFAVSSFCMQSSTYNISLVGFLIVISHCLEKLSKMESKEFCLKQGWKRKFEFQSGFQPNSHLPCN